MTKNNDKQPKKESELKKWGGVGALGAGSILPSAGMAYMLNTIPKRKKTLIYAGILGSGALGALGTYGVYRGGKAVVNKLRGKKKTDNAQYSLFSNDCVAKFGVMKNITDAVKNKAKKDTQKVVDSVIDEKNVNKAVGTTLRSGRKYVKKLWNRSPKLRRNVKIAGVAGAGLVGLNALTGLKTVYDIGKGITNKITGKKREYSMFLTDVAQFAQITDEDRRRSTKYARRGAIGFGLANTLRNTPYVLNAPGTKTSKALSLAVGLGLNSAIGYGGGKLAARLRRGSGKDKTITPQETKKKGGLGRKLVRGAAVGAVGLGGLTLAGSAIRQGAIRSKMKDARNLLGLKNKFTPDDLKKAQRQAVRKYHPDTNPGIDGNLIRNANDAVEKLKGNSPEINKLKKNRNSLLGVGTTTTALGAAGIYGTRKKKEKTTNYNALNNQIVLFKEPEQQPKKKSLLKKALKYGTIGGVGLMGLTGAKRLLGYGRKYNRTGFKNPTLLNPSK